MARIAKFVLGLAVVAAVAAAATYVAIEIDLIAGALVVLGALILVALVVRVQTARAEKQGMAEWKDVLDADAPDDAFFSSWTATTPTTVDGTDPAPAPDEDLLIEAHTSAGLESLEEAVGPDEPEATVEDDPAAASSDIEGTAAAPAVSEDDATPADDLTPTENATPTDDPTHAAPVESGDSPVAADAADAAEHASQDDLDGGFPFDDPHDHWGDLPPLVPARDDGAAPSTPGGDPSDAPAPAGGSWDSDEGAREHAEVLSFAGAGAQAAPRRSLIDWTGPVHAVDEQVRSSDDILAASAATALPTPEDRPAPTGGTELARLLAKVEARLRDYE